MATSTKLEVPVAQDGLTVAGNIKVTVAVNVFGSKLTPIINEESMKKFSNVDKEKVNYRLFFTNVASQISTSFS